MIIALSSPQLIKWSKNYLTASVIKERTRGTGYYKLQEGNTYMAILAVGQTREAMAMTKAFAAGVLKEIYTAPAAQNKTYGHSTSRNTLYIFERGPNYAR